MDPKLCKDTALCRSHRCVPRTWLAVGLTSGMNECPAPPQTPGGDLEKALNKVDAFKGVQEECTRP